MFMRKHGFVWGVSCVFFSAKRILGSPYRWEKKVMAEYICSMSVVLLGVCERLCHPLKK